MWQVISPRPSPGDVCWRTSSTSRFCSSTVRRNRGKVDRRAALILLGRCSGIVLEKVCEYFYYNEKHKNSKDVPDMDIPPELCLELLMAADYLNSTFSLLLRLPWPCAQSP